MKPNLKTTRHSDPPTLLPLALLASLLFACAQPLPRVGDAGTDGKDGKDGISCTLVTDEDGQRRISCDDGTDVTLTDGVDGINGEDGKDGKDGKDGAAGTSCTAVDNGDGSKTISCEDGSEVVVKDGAICEVQSVVDNGNGTETLTCVGGFVLTIATRTPVSPCITAVLDAAAPWQTASPQVLGVCEETFTVVFTSYEKGTPRTLTLSEISFVLAKLIPGSPGVPDSWQSYINRTENPGAGSWPVTTTSQIQATRENNGQLVGLSPGIYAYTFKANVKNMTTPLAVSYQPTLTHRVGIEFRGSLANLGAGNLWKDFRPDGAAVTLTRNVATTSSCKDCHSGFAMHGGRTKDVEVCTVCHNPGTIDANSGNSLDLKVMAHKIHRGKNLPSVKAGGEYAIWGYNNNKYDFSAVSYPQDVRNCIKCHDGADLQTPDGDNWKEKGNVAVCTSCHEDTVFSAAEVTTGVTLHTGGEFTTGCMGCHSPAGIAKDPELAHRTLTSTQHNPNTPAGIPVFEHEIIEVTLSGDPATWVTAKFVFLADGSPLDFNALPAGITLAYTTVRVLWSNPYLYGNLPSPVAVAADFNHNSYTNRNLAWLQTNAVRDPIDGTYTALLGSVPAGAANIGVGIEGRAAVNAEVVTIASVVKGVGANATPRREVASTNKCLDCHERLDNYGHGGSSGNHTGYRVNDVNYCVACHNPTRTTSAPTNRPDSMAYMIHRIHTGRHEGRPNKHFPGNLADCNTCHIPRSLNTQGQPIAGTGTYELPIPENALAMSIKRDFSERVSPTGGACTACHDSSQAKLHANAASAVDGLFSAATDQCSVCHGPGASFDVSKVHKLK